MRFSEAWLREWVNPAVTTDELSHSLSMAGLEVDAVAPVAGAFEKVVVGHVQACERHPDADKLSVCQVDAGQAEPLQIVCGAPNVAAGMKVPVALVGAVLGEGFKIKKTKLRGLESCGMICSASELGLTESSEGILGLPEDAPLGQSLRDYLQLEDQSIEVDLTPNRSDCLGLAGIAREVGVIHRSPVNAPSIEAVAAMIEDRFPVHVDAPEACPRYTCRVIRGVDPDAVTPLWMQEKLRRSGLRSLGPVVDVTNYVLLELGQPMHAFDLATVDREIRVRLATPGEVITLLDGQELKLRDDTLVIADASRPRALAGIMGGEDSGVSAETRDILLESAFFAPEHASGKARSYGLHTDSSHRFERGVDPGLQVQAMERATRLLLDLAGGEPGPIVEVAFEDRIAPRPEIRLRRERVRKVLGVELEDANIVDILQRLGMRVAPQDQGWLVQAPTSRFDINIEVDLIEEIGRIHGYDNIPAVHGYSSTAMDPLPETAFSLSKARLALVDRDYYEAVTYSFVSPDVQRILHPDQTPVPLANPISADMAVMRTSLWSGLIQAARHNLARQQPRVRLFESGLRFVQAADGLEQDLMLAGVAAGPAAPEQWGVEGRGVDFFDVKADVEAILALTGNPMEFIFMADAHPSLHPGQSARIERNGATVGWLGMLHPEVGSKLDVEENLYLFELRLDGLDASAIPAFRPLSKFPAIRRDLALVLAEDVPLRAVIESVREAAPEILQDIRLFDVYNGEKVEPAHKSIALGLILQESFGTLTDQRVEEIVQGVLQRLQNQFNARLRD